VLLLPIADIKKESYDIFHEGRAETRFAGTVVGRVGKARFGITSRYAQIVWSSCPQSYTRCTPAPPSVSANRLAGARTRRTSRGPRADRYGFRDCARTQRIGQPAR